MGRRTCLPVLAKHQVSVVQGCCTPHVRPFLTIVGHIEGDSALEVEGGPEARAVMLGNHREPFKSLPSDDSVDRLPESRSGPGHTGVSPFMEELQDWLEPEGGSCVMEAIRTYLPHQGEARGSNA